MKIFLNAKVNFCIGREKWIPTHYKFKIVQLFWIVTDTTKALLQMQTNQTQIYTS